MLFDKFKNYEISIENFSEFFVKKTLIFCDLTNCGLLLLDSLKLKNIKPDKIVAYNLNIYVLYFGLLVIKTWTSNTWTNFGDFENTWIKLASFYHMHQ